jgi:hypothetical protein
MRTIIVYFWNRLKTKLIPYEYANYRLTLVKIIHIYLSSAEFPT